MKELFIFLLWVSYLVFVSAISLIGNLILLPIRVGKDHKFNIDDSVCLSLNKKGLITDEQMAQETNLADTLSPHVMFGYAIFIGPILTLLQKTNKIDNVTLYFVNKWLDDSSKKNIKYKLFILCAGFVGVFAQKLSIVFRRFPKIIQLMPILSVLSIISVSLLLEDPLYLACFTLSIYGVVFLEVLGKHLDISVNHSKGEIYLTAALLIIAMVLIANKVDSVYDGVTAALSYGLLLGSLGFTVGHELGHKKSYNAVVSRVIFFLSGYPQFFEVHNNVHHRLIGTDKDRSTALEGQTVFNFLKGQTRTYLNNVNCYNILMVLFLYSILMVSVSIFSFVIITMMMSWVLLEIVNYVQHKGLMRTKGIDEHVSWDTDNSFTNAYLFNLGKHGHHHKSGRLWHSDLKMLSDNKTTDGYMLQIINACL